MTWPVEERLAQAFDLTADLASSLDDETLSERLEQPSNTIWEQIWCLVGARESYSRAIEAGEWMGFTCSLSNADRNSRSRAVEALNSYRGGVERAVQNTDESSSPFVLDLLLHETQHHGQLIRYVYGLRLEFPLSWKERWNL